MSRFERCSGVAGIGAMLLIGFAATGSLPAAAATHTSAKDTDPKQATDAQGNAEDAKTLYALGVLISHNLDEFQLSPAEFERVKSGLIDGFHHRATQVDLAVDTPKIQALRRQRATQMAAKHEADGKVYLDKAAASPGATKTTRGAVLIPISAAKADGAHSPSASDSVLVNYEGKLIDGTVFDSSLQRGKPATFSLSSVIPCWSEVLPLMKVGDKSRIVCPPDLAYGAHGAPPKIGPQSTLDFQVELLEVLPAAAAAAPGPGASAGSAQGSPTTSQ